MSFKVKILRSRKFERVLWIECGKDFADALLSLLIMPVGTILKRLGEGGMIKSDDNGIFNLYASMKELEVSTFNVDREVLINPVVGGYFVNHFLGIEDKSKDGSCCNPGCGNEFYRAGGICDGCEILAWRICPSNRLNCLSQFKSQSYEGSSTCKSCGGKLEHFANVIQVKAKREVSGVVAKSSEGRASQAPGFVEKNLTFLVKEDLSIVKSSALSALELVQSMKTDINDLESKNISIGKEQGLLLVRAAMVSKTPLTDVFESLFKSNYTSSSGSRHV